MNDVDGIGIIRQHRRVTVKGQRDRLLEDGCRVIVELGTKSKQYARADVLKLVRPGTVVKVLHTFLLADPLKAKRTSGKRKDLLDAMSLIEKRGGTIKDLASGLSTADPEQRYALIALATDQLARDGQGLRTAKRNYERRGRPVRTWTPEEWKDAEAAWNSRKLKTWADVKAMLPSGMSMWRAYRAFGARDV